MTVPSRGLLPLGQQTYWDGGLLDIKRDRPLAGITASRTPFSVISGLTQVNSDRPLAGITASRTNV